MKTIKNISFLALTLLLTTAVFGQASKTKRPSKEKIKTMKVGYITEKLSLTTAEAQQFWPIYNAYDAKMEAIHKAIRKTHKKGISIDEMTDEAVEAMVNTHSNLRQKELDIQKEYHSQFKSVLPIKKVAKLYKANHDFKRDLLRKIKNHQGQGEGGHRGLPPGR